MGSSGLQLRKLSQWVLLTQPEDYALYPTESAENYKEMLLSLRERGLQEVLLFVSDGQVGLPEKVTDVFPKARHQACWTHLQRNVLRKVRSVDAAEVTASVRRVHQSESLSQAQDRLQEVVSQWKGRYPKLVEMFQGKDSLFSYFAFPEAIRRSLYTNNLAESLNKRLKRVTRSKEQFPQKRRWSERSVLIFWSVMRNGKAESIMAGATSHTI